MTDISIIILGSVLAAAIGLRELRDLQLNGYRAAIAPLKTALSLSISGAATVASLLFGFISAVAAGVAAAIISVVGIGIHFARYSALRTKLRFTRRAVRLLVLFSVIVIGAMTATALLSPNLHIKITVAFLLTGLTKPVARLSAAIAYPFEAANNRRYTARAARTLHGLDIIKIGITGSYGKTSCKNLLAVMLGKKYKVIKTEGNYNTPLGIAKTLSSYAGEELFIAELGARREGEIAELCHIIEPRYGIITGVTGQHLETFKDRETVYRTKRELALALPRDGFLVYNADNEYTRKLGDECQTASASVGLNHGKVRANNLKMTANGSEFEIIGLGEPFRVGTRLLGRHNVLNVLLCATLAFKLGVGTESIAEAVAEIKPTPHRLEVSKNGGLTIIDDSYNANIEGAACALEVLTQFDKRKVVYTQGIVEAGAETEAVNRNLGNLVGAVADLIILSGENSRAIERGVREVNATVPLHRFSTLAEAQSAFPELLKHGDVLLIQNDLP